MTQQLNPYLRFSDGKCREAMSFYQECLGGNLSLTTVKDTPVASQIPQEVQDQVMPASLTSGNLVLLGSDLGCEEGFIKGNTLVLQLECSSEEEIMSLYSKLATGGEATYPVVPSFWGGLYGQVTDRFGISWMLNYQKS